jgi:23S rRNA (uracil1939-C5)-methyltransferase
MEASGQKPTRGEEFATEVVDLAYGGAGVVRLNGWAAMVRGAFPGDRVRVRVGRKRKGVYEAELLELLEPSPWRVEPACPHLAICGGCALQGLDAREQTRLKAVQAAELLRRIGHVVPESVGEPWHSPRAYEYRNKMEFTFAARPWMTRADLDSGRPFEPGPALGLHPRGVFQGVFNVTDCRLQSPLSNQILRTVRGLAQAAALPAYDCRRDAGLLRHVIIRQSATSDDLLVVLVTRREEAAVVDLAQRLHEAVAAITGIVLCINRSKATIATGDRIIPLFGRPYWREELAGMRYRIGPISFFQTQTAGGEALVAEALEVGGFAPGQRVLDLYCGIGAFSLPIARRVGTLMGVEVLPAAVEEARFNARESGIANAQFIASPVEAKAGAPQAEANRAWEAPVNTPPGRPPWDVILVDPPRSGLHPRALEKVAALGAPRIVYVSCNPATLARDAGILVEKSGYRARRLRVFDLFPQTPHLESILLLERPPG